MDNSPQPVLVEDLTERELEVLRLKAQNRSNQQIADELVLALSTVKWYVRQIYGKLGVGNRRQAVARAQALGLIEGPRTPSFRPPHNLPAQTTPFIGRARELDDLEALLADSEMRLITILAPGGMGKTRLGLAVAEAHLDRFMDGVYMVPLAPLRASDQIVTAVAEAAHFPFMADDRSPKQQVLDFLREKHMLLVLDNFEHLLDGAELVTEMLHAAPDVQIVATTRERLNLRGETVYSIGGMVFPDWETPDDALQYDAVKLFMQCAEQACPGFELHPDDLRYLARICRLVEGMPLGIVLAAAWTEVLSLEEIAGEIQQSFDFLAAEMRDVPRRQWSIRAVFQPTWQRLTDAERDAFMRFAVFRGGCTRDAAQAVTGADLQTLQGLINKALLDRDSAGRYHMHELLRQYADQQLDDAGARHATLDAHCAHYADFMGVRENDLKGGDRQLAALDDIGADFENIKAAWTWAIERQRTGDLLNMEWGLFIFIRTRGLFAVGLELFQAALTVDQDRGLQGRIMARYGEHCAAVLRSQEADEWYRKSLDIARETGELALMAYVLRDRAFLIAEHDRDFEKAQHMADESLTLSQKLGDPWYITLALYVKGVVELYEGHYRSGLEFTEQALAVCRQTGNRIPMAVLFNAIGVVYTFWGEYPQAKQYFEECLALAREVGKPEAIALALGNLGANASDRGDYPLAVQRSREAIDVHREMGQVSGHQTHIGLAYSLALAGRFDEVDECLTELAVMMQSVENNLVQWLFRRRQSEIACLWGDFAEALRLAHTARDYAQTHDMGREELQSWVEVGLCEIRLGQARAAWQHVLRSLPGMKERPFVLRAVGGLAAAAAGQHQPERAVEWAALVHHHQATQHINRVYAANLLADLQAALPPDVYAAAVARGKALDLDAVVAELLEEFAEQNPHSALPESKIE